MRAGPFTLMLALGIVTTPALAEEASLPDEIVDALNKADGVFPGYRATHAKGLVAEGNFKPTREAAELSKASLFQGATVPATFRFASGSGIPTIADGSPRANPHALAKKLAWRCSPPVGIETGLHYAPGRERPLRFWWRVTPLKNLVHGLLRT